MLIFYWWVFFFFFLHSPEPNKIYTWAFVGSVRCVYETEVLQNTRSFPISQVLIPVPCMTSTSTISVQIEHACYLWKFSRIGTIASKRFYSCATCAWLVLCCTSALTCERLHSYRLRAIHNANVSTSQAVNSCTMTRQPFHKLVLSSVTCLAKIKRPIIHGLAVERPTARCNAILGQSRLQLPMGILHAGLKRLRALDWRAYIRLFAPAYARPRARETTRIAIILWHVYIFEKIVNLRKIANWVLTNDWKCDIL